MNVTPIVNTGLRFDLKHYQALKTSYAGTNLWFVNNSELLRNKLYPFLPRMEYDAGTNTVTASIVENGRELLSTSEAATPSLNNVPVSELQKLEKLIHDLLAEAAKDDTPDNVKQLVNAFPLPKPNSMPECYRLYGTGSNKRLAIIWGLARKDSEGNEDASSVVSLKDFTYGLEYTPKKNYTWLWILLGLAAAGIGICYTLDKQTAPTTDVIMVPEEIPAVLTTTERQLPVPQQIEILKEKETSVSQQIVDIENKQEELKKKLADMDQQSAEAEASRKELDELLARHKALKTELDAIKTTRTELEKTPAPEVVDGGNTPPKVVPTPQGPNAVKEPEEIPAVLTAEQRQLPVPQQIEILKEKETSVSQQIVDIENKQEELKKKLADMDQQSAEAEASRKELDELLARHKALKTELDAIKTTRTELEKTPSAKGGESAGTVGISGNTSKQTATGGNDKKPEVVIVDGDDTPDNEEEPSVVDGGDKPVDTTGNTPDNEEEPSVVDGGDKPVDTTAHTPDDEEEPTVVDGGSPLTEAEKQLPVEEQLKVLDRKEKEIKKEVDKLEAEQTTLQNELDVIAQKQKQNAGVVDWLTKLLKEYEALAAKLKRKDISPEERARLTERKKELENDIDKAEQQLETVSYNTKKTRLEAIDKQLEEYKKQNRQIDQARKTLQSTAVATPPREVNVEIYKADDYKVTHISHEPIDGSDKVRVKLNISPLKAGQKFTRITVDKEQATANGDVVLDLTAGAQKLQLKIWVDNNPEPQYITPIYVNTSVIEK